MDYYVYLYLDPSRNNEPLYIGKGRKRRHLFHLTHKNNHHPFYNRLSYLKNIGVQPTIVFLCKGIDEETALMYEMKFIKQFGRKDLGLGTLLNLTDGGEKGGGHINSPELAYRKGSSMRGKNHSDSAIKKISEFNLTSAPRLTCQHCNKEGNKGPMSYHIQMCSQLSDAEREMSYAKRRWLKEKEIK